MTGARRDVGRSSLEVAQAVPGLDPSRARPRPGVWPSAAGAFVGLQSRIGNAATASLTNEDDGEPVDSWVRARVEPLIHTDLANVRVHLHHRAAMRAREHNAVAVTVGQDIFFAAGKFEPSSAVGLRLLVHELTHAAQQSRVALRAGTALPTGPRELERSADAVADAIISGRSAPATGTASGPFVQCKGASEIKSEFSSWYGQLDEEALGAELLRRVLRDEFQVMHEVLDALGRTDRDDVALGFMTAAGDPTLAVIAQSTDGRRVLDRLFDELTAGHVGDEESKQANRILAVKGRRIGIERFETAVTGAMKIFPHKLPGPFAFNAAPILAQRLGNGRVWVKQPVYVLGTRGYRDETRTLPTAVFAGGFELPEDEIVGVRMYDLGGEIHYRPALYLVQISNATTAKVLQDIVEIGVIGFTAGLGSGAVAAATLPARILLWADRAAAAFGVLSMIIRDNRGWIIERFGDKGRAFLHYFDIVDSAIAIYGGGRALVGLGRLALGLRKAYVEWRTAAKLIEGDLNNSEREALTKIVDKTDDVIAKVDQLGTGVDEAAAAKPRSPGGIESDVAPEAARVQGPPSASELPQVETGMPAKLSTPPKRTPRGSRTKPPSEPALTPDEVRDRDLMETILEERMRGAPEDVPEGLPESPLDIRKQPHVRTSAIRAPEKILAANLERSGMPRPTEGVWGAHHIVPANDTRAEAKALQKVLSRNEIDINDAANGVWLPQNRSQIPKLVDPEALSIHSEIHTNDYLKEVLKRLRAADESGPEVVRLTLQQIADELRNYDFHF